MSSFILKVELELCGLCWVIDIQEGDQFSYDILGILTSTKITYERVIDEAFVDGGRGIWSSVLIEEEGAI